MFTDEGIEGLGEATVIKEWGGDHGRYFGESPALTRRLIESILGPALEDTDPFNIEAAHQRMDMAVKGYPYAKAAVDEALHDIKGKALSVPVYQLLGGQIREEIPLAHSLGWLEYDVAVNEAVAAVSEGIKTIKIKVGRDATYDVRVVKEVREAIGPELDIVVDANQGWPTPKYAIGIIERMHETGSDTRSSRWRASGRWPRSPVGRPYRSWPTRARGHHRTSSRSSNGRPRT